MAIRLTGELPIMTAMRRRLHFLLPMLMVVVTGVSGIIGNVAASYLPDFLKPYLRWSWPAFGVSLALILVLTILHVRMGEAGEDAEAGDLPAPPLVAETPAPAPAPQPGLGRRLTDLADVPADNELYGRDRELAELEQAVLEGRYRVVMIGGLGGIGKTTLAARLAKRVASQFECVLWRSLRNAPSFDDLASDVIGTLSDHRETSAGKTSEQRMSLLLRCLREHRCLLVLDNFESVMEPATSLGACRATHAEYCQFLSRIGSADTDSCVVVTSRDKPQVIAALEATPRAARPLQLGGVDKAAGAKILEQSGLEALADERERLAFRYGGNPLALRLVGATVRELFSGDIALFEQGETVVFGDIENVLEQQWERLGEVERDVALWLAIEREWTSIETLYADVVRPIIRADLLSALIALERRSMIERTGKALFSLQPVIMEFLTKKLVAFMLHDITAGHVTLFGSHALLKAQSRDYVRAAQQRLLLRPLSEMLLRLQTKGDVQKKLIALLERSRDALGGTVSYFAGNWLNVAAELELDLTGLRFSGLAVRQAYLRDVSLRNVDFSGCHLATSAFTETFGSALAVDFSGDGQRLAAGTGSNEIWIWSVGDGKQLAVCKGHQDWVRAVAFSSDGRLLISGSEDETVRVWDTSTGECLRTLVGHTGRVRSVAFLPGGGSVASASEDGTVRIWSAESGALTDTVAAHRAPVRWIAASPDGALMASASTDATVKLWSTKDLSKPLRTLVGHRGQVWSLAFHPQAPILASGGEDGTLMLWPTDGEGEPVRPLRILKGHGGAIRSVAFDHSGGHLASGSEDHSIRIWQLSDDQCIHVLNEHTDRLRAVAYSPAGDLLASASEDQTVRLWDADRGHSLRTFQGYINRIWSVAFSPDGRYLAAGSDDKLIRVWDVVSGTLVTTLRRHANSVRAVAFARDDSHLLSGSDDHTVRLWNVGTGRVEAQFAPHSSRVGTVAVSPDGDLFASGSDDCTACIWDASSRALKARLTGHAGWIWSVAFSPDGRTLATGSEDGTTRLWNAATGALVRVFETGRVWMLSYSPKGDVIATGCDDRSVRLWDVQSGECVRVLQGHGGRGVWALDFHPGGALLGSGGDDHQVMIWDLDSGTSLALAQHTLRLRSVRFSPDGTLLASAGDDGVITLWDVPGGTRRAVFKPDRPYEGLNITGATGLTQAQRLTLVDLGARMERQ